MLFQWSVFSCGHCICCRCAWVLLRQAGVGPRHRNVHVKCPMCRIPTVAQEISYVSTARTQTEEVEDSVTVKVLVFSMYQGFYARTFMEQSLSKTEPHTNLLGKSRALGLRWEQFPPLAWLRVFPRFTLASYRFSRSLHLFHVFPRFATVTCFRALCAGYTSVFPRIVFFYMFFPALH